MHPLLTERGHRPYPLNAKPWAMQQTWFDLAFLHWPIDPAVLRSVLPTGLQVDTYDGLAWIGVVPFAMTLRPRGVPFVGMKFLELNVRTYVTRNGKSGVYFFSLDAGSQLAVLGARTFFQLPYFKAFMTLTRKDDWYQYTCQRNDQRGAASAFVGCYRPVGLPFQAERNSLEHFLVERYCLFVEHQDKYLCGDIHHAPWMLQQAEAEITTNSMVQIPGVDLDKTCPHVLYACAIDTIEWWPDEV